MEILSKICDTADWFDNEFNSIVINELKEQPRLHRKQWEFAMIFLALRKLGFLEADKTGLSMGGGTERVLYSIAKHVKKLFVTDLYDENTSWDCARTLNPDDLIKNNMPSEITTNNITALKMDMRSLDFEDNTFDFCYSSCAFEHIGSFDDFGQHLDEVYRCLKPEGVYVFTTELQLGNTTIQDKNNYIFSPGILQIIIENAKLSPEINPDVSLTDIVSNYSLPSNISRLCSDDESSITAKIMNDYPHTILLRGQYPFTSIQIILRKKKDTSKNNRLIFEGIDTANAFAKKSLERYRNIVENSKLIFSPFSSLPGNVSPYFQDHFEFFSGSSNNYGSTVFHTDYFWLGNGNKTIHIELDPDDNAESTDSIIQIRIHAYAILNSETVECVYENDISVTGNNPVSELISLQTDDDYCYAILAKVVTGNFNFKTIKIESLKSDIKEIEVQESIQ